MTDNEKIEKLVHWSGDYDKLSFGDSFPDYLNDDAAAMGLLDTLVEKNINYSMTGWNNDGSAVHTIEIDHVELPIIHAHSSTRRAAVCAAVLELIGKEVLDGKL